MDALIVELRMFCREYINTAHWPEFWRDPLLAAAPTDQRFDCLPRVASSDHLLPRELMPGCETLLVYFLPFTPEMVQGNAAGKFASRDWGLALDWTNELIEAAGDFLRDRLADRGGACELTPATYNFDPETLTARWSHKHLACLAGLGRFGVNAQLITPLGCAGRLGSLVTDLELGDHPLVQDRELCLHRAGKPCLKCMAACPVGAVTPEGIHRPICNQRLQVNRKRLARNPGFSKDMEVCAKSVAGMPCAVAAPVVGRHP